MMSNDSIRHKHTRTHTTQRGFEIERSTDYYEK